MPTDWRIGWAFALNLALCAPGLASHAVAQFGEPKYPAKLGIVLKQKPVYASADRARMKNFNYDFASIALREARDPAAELWRNLNSADADVPGSENIIGVKSHVVDELIKKLYEASTRQE